MSASPSRPAGDLGSSAGRRLVLLRHAQAEHHGGLSDEMRTLHPSGRRQAAHVGHHLAAAGVVPDLVICSIAVRTRQTWELVASALGARPPVEYSEDLYGSGISGTLEIVTGIPKEARTVLVVGHEPVMSGVAYVLAGPGSDSAAVARVRVGVPTGTYSVLEVDRPWDRLERGSATLTTVFVPPHHH